ncbi:tryptophan halogenase family protein [Thalassotalea agarivorans]|uniref:Tryptophan halogenase n=1 Tax=Thalassotalea agarivorans TaxID=349064 RepID=A0A1I0HV21_THASX|nr:tryptophan halogenase family protein [Thalassotalea agarivorans]SET87680.1 tryptophan halogenase [Thalassotalea agarivorans]
MSEKIRHIVIVGGGTAGWLTANHLAKQLQPSSNTDVTITLVESPNIPTVGVGEGTVPMMRQSLQYLGISETDFLQQCDATFKQGIKFVNWEHNPADKGEHSYHHIFDYPAPADIDSTLYWLNSNTHQSFVDAVSIQGRVCDNNLAPKLITTPEYQGAVSYAYHLDAAKFAKLLTKHATDMGVKHVKATVEQVETAPLGDISAIITKELGAISGDFFVDCTGFQSLLLGKTLDVSFIDQSDVLFADRALAVQVPYVAPSDEIPSYTIASAQDAGWIWDIGLTTRRGTGYVFSSKYCSDEQAKYTLAQYLGDDALVEGARFIDMNIGYREKFWFKNCAAIGLSQGFVEPLEATGLLVFDATARMLAEQFPTFKEQMPLMADCFNERVKASWLHVIDFIKLHYCISKRDDTPFWRDNRSLASIPLSLQQKLERWALQPPHAYDFENKFSVFNKENYLYVLYGMHFDTDATHLAYKAGQEEHAKAYFQQLEQHCQTALDRLPKHRELLEKIKRFGLQKV